MQKATIALVDQFYEVYSRTQRLGFITPCDWQVIQKIQAQKGLSAELQEMLTRLLRRIKYGQVRNFQEKLLADMLSHHPDLQGKLSDNRFKQGYVLNHRRAFSMTAQVKPDL
ncbi:MAG: hypothetical protein F6J87_13830 [Spirulina sp. SIO3F2]|nr:hypothetical protein [Spirulina sp. SIO3F2]